MNLLESDSQSFVVRIWLEETVQETGRVNWRGHITHVPSGRRRYVKSLDEINVFIAPYLQAMGMDLGIGWHLKQWLRRKKLWLRSKPDSILR